MSLLNQMLRDLEQHKSSTPATAIQESVVKVPTNNNSKNFHTPLLVLLCLIAFVSNFLTSKQETNIKFISQPLAIPAKTIHQSLPTPKQPKLVLSEQAQSPTKKINKPVSTPEKTIPLTQPEPVHTKKTSNSIQPAPISSRQQAKQYYQQAIQTTDKSNAIALLNKSISLNPKYSQSRLLLAQLLINTGEQQSAINILDSSLKSFPYNLSFIMVRAQLYLQEKETGHALQLLTKVPAPLKNEAYLSLLAAAYQQNKSYSQASDYYQSLVKLNNTKAEYWLGLALAHDALNHSKQAYNAYHKALALNKLNTDITSYIQQRLTQLP